MRKKTERMIGTAALIVGIIVIAVILLHAWKMLTAPRNSNLDSNDKTGSVEAEAGDDIWVEETELDADKNIVLSLKEAVLGESQQKKDLIVFEQKVSDITKVEDKGILPFEWASKYRYIKYSGTATYTVDLSGIDDDHLKVDEDKKTITIYIPHAVQKLNLNEDETQADETENSGIFSIGDLKQTEEARAEVIARVMSNMEQKLKDEKTSEQADRMAKLSVWEIYQPVVTKVSPEYTVATEFTESR